MKRSKQRKDFQLMNRDFRRRNWSEDRFPASWIKAISRFFQRIILGISAPFRKLSKDRSPLRDKRPGILRTILFPFLWTAWLLYSIVANVIELVVSWSSSRQSRAILAALPSLIAFGLFTFVIAYLYNTRSGALVNTYLLRATKAEKVESFETARMYYQKLLQLDYSNQSYEFLIARTYDSEGNIEEATRRMSKLRSQPDVAGVVNFWFAQKTLEREELKEDQKWKQCLAYLEEFLAEAPKHREANILALRANTVLADMYGVQGLTEIAIDYLLKAENVAATLAEVSGRSYLALARIQRQIAQKYESLANPQLQKIYDSSSLKSNLKAIEFLKEEWAESQKDIKVLLLLSDSYIFQRDFEQAARQLDIALQIDVQGQLTPHLREVKSRILAEEASFLYEQGESLLSKCIEKVDQALLLSPRNEAALVILAKITVANIDEVSLAAKQKLERAIGDSAAPFSVHLILGSYAAAEKNDDRALRHLRQALLLNPKATAVLNNLAFVLARQPEPRFDEALSLIDQALKVSPKNPRFLDTRGNIYLQMKQYELAFHDLELAEVKIKNSQQLYENLLFLTKELGFEDVYRRKFEERLELLKSSKVSQN